MKTTPISSIAILLLILNSVLAYSQTTVINKHFESLLNNGYQAPKYKLFDFEHDRELFPYPFPNYHFRASNDLVVLKLDSIIMNEEWKSQFTYDSCGNTLQIAYSSWNPTNEEWTSTNGHEYIYNENNQIISNTYYEYFPSIEQLLPVTRYEYTFDNNGQLIQMIYYLINADNVLALASKTDYSYNSNSLLVNNILSIWDNQTEQWQFSTKDEFEYDASGDIVFELRYDWDGFSNIWMASWKILSDYDSHNNLTNISYYDCFGNSSDCSIVWENEFIYDDNSNLILETYFSMDEMTQQLNPNSKTQYSYDNQNNLIEALDFYCIYDVTPVEWIEVYKYNYIYNDEGLLNEQKLSFWNSDLNMWVVIGKTETLYDDFFNETEFINYTYDEETGVLIALSKEVHIFDNYAVFDLLILPPTFGGEIKITNMQNYSFDLDQSEWLLSQDYIFYYSEGRPTQIIDNSLSNISVFPNPATEMITVETPISSVGKQTIEILDSNGKIVYSTLLSSSKVEINISGFRNGLYFLNVFSGKDFITKKFIKSNN